MKGVVIAGGSGSRLYPVTRVISKHLLPVYDKPLLYYPLLALRDAGIREVLVVAGRGYEGQYQQLLGQGKELGLKLAYEIQEKPGGIAQALGLAEEFAAGDAVLSILGDNIMEDRLGPAVEAFRRQERGARVFLKEVTDPERFGVAVIKDERIVEIVEKPKVAPGKLVVTGIYMYDNRVFSVIKALKPSARGELEITDVSNFYVKEGSLTYEILRGEWIDAGTFDSLLYANNFIAKNHERLVQFHLPQTSSSPPLEGED